ncbi:MAG: phenylalanine--tRNA ligase subunit beta [Candidatus Methanomethylophilaceae archaeon]|jgi:phenylalanyl-tRNA synthetase beta chain
MPLINFGYGDLCSLLGEKVPQEELVEKIPLMGADMHDTEAGSDEMAAEFFPNRPDLYCVEGLARSLRAFLGIRPGMQEYDVSETDIDVYIDGSVKDVRPFFLCAAVYGLKINDTFLKSMMEMQEKLHITVGRKRKKVAIGIHDLDKITPPFTYSAVKPSEVSFVPLNGNEKENLDGILKSHEKGREYAHLLEGFEKYPIIRDSENNVLSFPPIINGALTAVTEKTVNVFIDVTGNDEKAVKGALDIVTTALAERGGKIGSVTMHRGKEKFLSPNLAPSVRTISAEKCDKFLGTEMGAEGIAEALRSMGMDAFPSGDSVEVRIPSTRLDIMHDVDIYEDAAAGYGFEKFGKPYKLSQTVAKHLPEALFSDKIRDVMIGLGYTEVTTLTLSNEKDEFLYSGMPEVDTVRIKNPITEDHTCLRANLFPSLMRILRHNRRRNLPQKIFEVGYAVRDGKNSLHLCALMTASKTSFTEAKSMTESVLREIGCEYTPEVCNYETFVPGRGAFVTVNGKRAGVFGEVSPKVVTDFGINHPVLMAELDLEQFINGRTGLF